MTRRRGTNTVGTLEEYRELVALVGSLDQPDDAITPQVVADRLGCSLDHARDLVDLVATTWDADGTYLPLYETGTASLQLLGEGGTRGRRMRLTPNEARALLAALGRAGMGHDDSLRERLAALLPEGEGTGQEAEVGASSQVGALLTTCAQALREGLPLSFSYQAADGTQTRRLVQVERTRSEGGHWYLDAFDLSRQAGRLFRVDRMSQARLEGEGALPPQLAGASGQATRSVTVLFRDPSLLDLFDWHGARVVSRAKAGVRVSLPDYGGTWLVAHLAACGSGARADDAGLRARVRAWAKGQTSRPEALASTLSDSD